MSWSASFPGPVRKDFLDEDLAVERATSTPGVAEMADDVVEQFAAARAAVKELVGSGAFGDGSKEFSVQLSGHANPGHEPLEGWSNDCVSVHVAQRS